MPKDFTEREYRIALTNAWLAGHHTVPAHGPAANLAAEKAAEDYAGRTVEGNEDV